MNVQSVPRFLYENGYHTSSDRSREGIRVRGASERVLVVVDFNRPAEESRMVDELSELFQQSGFEVSVRAASNGLADCREAEVVNPNAVITYEERR